MGDPGADEEVVVAAGVGKIFTGGDAEIVALRDVDLTVRAGEFVAITGPSGSGKSTLLHLLGGLDGPTTGRITVRGHRLDAMGAEARTTFRRHEVGFVFQFFNLVGDLTAVENVALPLLLAGMSRRTATDRAAEMLDGVGLGERGRHRPGQLSGGQMQRVAIARALVHRPAVVLADEPTGNLDRTAGTMVLELLRDTAASQHAAVVMVTHDERAAALAERTVTVVDGRLGPAAP
jgi:ABC-type lipoprotein export system ATPase subunit